MPDGQLISHPIQIFVTHDLGQREKTFLVLVPKRGNFPPITPSVIGRNQIWQQTIDGKTLSFTGTLLLFDLTGYELPFYKAMTQVTPSVSWTEQTGDPTQEKEFSAIGTNVYIGNPIGALGSTLLLIIALLGLIIFSTRKADKGPLSLILNPHTGRLSLWRAQIAAWTVSIGGVVAGFGLVRLEVPDVPESLPALMGLSLATGGVSYIQGGKKNELNPRKKEAEFADLVSDMNSNGQLEFSIARAQMLFWTGLMLVLFTTKSIFDGELWEVPMEMVALMGMSQAGYLGPKMKIGESPSRERADKDKGTSLDQTQLQDSSTLQGASQAKSQQEGETPLEQKQPSQIKPKPE